MRHFAAAIMVITLVLSGTPLFAQTAKAPQAGSSCIYCGMDTQKFAHTSMLIEYEDGSTAATCSIHCAAIDLAISIGKTPRAIKVGDYNTREAIDAVTACWTIGGDVQGVMTSRAKWAFGKKADCTKFAREHKARVATFEDALKAAYEDMYADTKMIRDKRKAMKPQSHQHQ